MTGYKTAELTVKITEARIGQKYRCVITDAAGNKVTSDEVRLLKPTKDIEIITQPENYAGNIGDEAKFEVVATGENLSYQWQYCNPGSTTWKNSSMTGYKTAELTVKITEARIGQKYRCVITDVKPPSVRHSYEVPSGTINIGEEEQYTFERCKNLEDMQHRKI